MVRFLAKFGGSSFFLFRQLNGIVSQTFLIMQKSLLSLFTLLPLCGVAQTEKPNVILLVADDLGYGDLSCYGATRVQTPAVDSLATSGIRFTNMHACASTSTPSRYAMLTGEYPFRRPGTDVAAGNAGMIIKPQRVTVADLMQRGGYATAAIGKWHLGLGSRTAEQNWNGEIDQTPADLGFDYHYIMAATADRVPCVYIENGRVADYDPSAPIEVSYRSNFPGEPTGRTHPELLTKLKPSHGHDQSIVNGISRIGFMKGGGKALWRDEDIADSILSHAVKFIDSHRRSPFFMYLCTNDVHVPRYPHERFRGKSPMGLRGEAILQFDWCVSQLMQALRERGLDKNTLILITSDNGPVLDDGYQDRAEELAGSHRPGGPLRGGKYGAYEAGAQVPFIAYWPQGIRGGKVSDALCSQIDIPTTLAALAGVTPAEGEVIDSENHLSTWTGKDEDARDFAVCMTSNRSLTLRTQHYKYIAPSNGSPMITWGPKIETGYKAVPQIFDLSKSSYEEHNIAPQRPKLLKRMQKMLGEIRSGK